MLMLCCCVRERTNGHFYFVGPSFQLEMFFDEVDHFLWIDRAAEHDVWSVLVEHHRKKIPKAHETCRGIFSALM